VDSGPAVCAARGIPTEVPLGEDEGMSSECAATFDSLQSLRREYLLSRVGALDPLRRQEMCAALRAMSDC
jgi:mRNA-degrading endonuclease toxin of MazEF toxin-antitoxin module